MVRDSYILFLLLVGVLPGTAAACSGCDRYGFQQMNMSMLCYAVERYTAEHGAIPESDADRSWFQRLIDGEYVYAEDMWYGIDPDTQLPLDLYGHPLVLDVVDGEIVIRAVGENGIDDGGDGDDWQLGREPNLGYWYKKSWVEQWMFGVVIAIITTALCVIVAQLCRSNVRRFVWSLLIIGVLNSIVLWSARPGPVLRPAPMIGVQVAAGVVALLAGSFFGVTFSIIGAVRDARKRGAELTGLCGACRYDLRGLPTLRCPECGTVREDESGSPGGD